jgi:hypothetical protein
VIPGLFVSVTPNKAGRNLEYQLQVYYRGAWQTIDSFDHPLASQSVFTLFEEGLYDPAHRWQFRIRAVYSGQTAAGPYDYTNLTTAGAWQYFMVLK